MKIKHITKILKKILDLFFPKKKVDEKNLNLFLKKNILFTKNKNCIIFFEYKNEIVRKSILDMKFQKNFHVADFFGKKIYENILEILEDLKNFENFENPILVSVPTSLKRKAKRGYDQNFLILKSFQKEGGKNFIKWEKNILKKKFFSKAQSSTKNKKERILNIKNSFYLKNSEKIKGKNILLFDDVMTTGATFLEAKKILKKAGAKKIIFMAIAH